MFGQQEFGCFMEHAKCSNKPVFRQRISFFFTPSLVYKQLISFGFHSFTLVILIESLRRLALIGKTTLGLLAIWLSVFITRRTPSHDPWHLAMNPWLMLQVFQYNDCYTVMIYMDQTYWWLALYGWYVRGVCRSLWHDQWLREKWQMTRCAEQHRILFSCESQLWFDQYTLSLPV